MLLLSSLSFSLVFAYLTSALPQKLLASQHESHYSIESARANGNHVFNAIHICMRQFGSSIKHNGMSVFPAIVPEGTMLYHGTNHPEKVAGFEWLAFEIEHAENFARARGPPGRGPPGGGPPGGGPPGEHEPPRPDEFKRNSRQVEQDEHDDSNGDGPSDIKPGYLHMYRANRPLKLLYIDGMSAGKTNLGSLDSTDYILTNLSLTTDDSPPSDHAKPHGPMREQERAEALCAQRKKWDVDGFLRMEAGFEIIYCDFSDDGLEFFSHTLRPTYDSPESFSSMRLFEYARALEARYDGITAGRVVLNYSAMHSAFFYDVNLTNPDVEHAEIPRLAFLSKGELALMKTDLDQLMAERPHLALHKSVDWQGVSDMLVSRYARRLKFMSTNATNDEFLTEINNLLNVFVDYEESNIAYSIKKCTSHYLPPVAAFSTVQDHLINAAVTNVTREICSTLFDVRGSLLKKREDSNVSVDAEKKAVQSLIDWLDWTVWKECGPCKWDEVCFVAVWPWGSKEDHYNPRCKTAAEISGDDGSGRYWDGFGGGPGHGGPPE